MENNQDKNCFQSPNTSALCILIQESSRLEEIKMKNDKIMIPKCPQIVISKSDEINGMLNLQYQPASELNVLKTPTSNQRMSLSPTKNRRSSKSIFSKSCKFCQKNNNTVQLCKCSTLFYHTYCLASQIQQLKSTDISIFQCQYCKEYFEIEFIKRQLNIFDNHIQKLYFSIIACLLLVFLSLLISLISLWSNLSLKAKITLVTVIACTALVLIFLLCLIRKVFETNILNFKSYSENKVKEEIKHKILQYMKQLNL